ncbi:MAG: S-adenosylmethionine decarboxylase [Pseudomonadales bacterium]|nr:S-adenosylmethionine decarboxylase [Pseudomonadales bacterium]
MKAEVFNVSYWLAGTLTASDISQLEQGLAQSGFILLDKVDHAFQPVGYTQLILLAESHFALHTFPEDNKTYLEICSCNRDKLMLFISWLEKQTHYRPELRYRHL